MRIFCEFCAKGQKFVRVRLKEKFPNAFKMMKIRMKSCHKTIAKDKFSFFIAEIP
jgi:hypothetical protein